MRIYEITFITKEDKREKPVKPILEGLGGKILNISSLGQKTFAYPIKKENRGFYTTAAFEIEPEKVVELNKKLGLEEEILRFLMILAQPAAQPIKEIKPPAIVVAEPKEIVKEPAKEIMPVKEKVVEPKPKKVSRKVKELIEEPVSEKERMDALDKKLEELLKE